MPKLKGDGGPSKTWSGERAKINFEMEVDALNFINKNLGDLIIDLTKLDTEANEHFVLSGANLVLIKHRPIIQCEILKKQIENEIESILSKYDYIYYRSTNKGLEYVTTFLNNNTEFLDYYLVPKKKNILFKNSFSNA